VGATIHLHPTAPLAERVLLPGDPGRALRLAQELLEEPRMFNHNRGLWGYSGVAKHDGCALSIQSTGMGGPSAAIVASELIDLGARRLLRVGTCGALDAALALGDLVIASAALAADGTSRALGAGKRVAADPLVVEALGRAGEAAGAAGASSTRAGASGAGGARIHTGTVVSSDLFYDARGREAVWAADGALAIEMECATVFALAAGRGVSAGALLAVTDLLALTAGGLEPSRRRIDPDALHEAELRLGTVAAVALGAQPSSPS
jgi:DeoD family purine-nucleoside phosphorylase